MVGKTFALEKSIVNGQGKIKIEDTLWYVDGEDASAGTRVKVSGIDAARLKVKKI